MDIENVNGTNLGLCVCGRRIYADVQQGAVIHDVPVCKMFLELEPDKFLTYVRRSRGIADENQVKITLDNGHPQR
jgi:hypothetical protein